MREVRPVALSNGRQAGQMWVRCLLVSSNVDSAALLCPMQQAGRQSLCSQSRTARFLSHEALGGVEPLREPGSCSVSSVILPAWQERGWNEVTLWMAGSGGRHPVAVLPSFMLVQITLFPDWGRASPWSSRGSPWRLGTPTAPGGAGRLESSTQQIHYSLELERELSAGHSVWVQVCVSDPRSHTDG